MLPSAAMRKALSLVAMFAVVGCSGKKDEERAAPPQPGSATIPSPKPAPAGVQIFVDDVAVATVDAAQVAAWPRLDSLIPEPARRLGKWQAISTRGAKPAELAKPFETYRDYVPVLFPGESGAVSFGMFDPVELGKRGKPALREDAITELRIKLDASGMRGGNDHGGGEVIDPAKVTLAFQTASGETRLTGEALLSIPREPMPGGGGDAKGWPIQKLLAAAGIKSFTSLRLHDAGGMTLPLDSKELDASTIPFIKLNRQGSLRYRLYKKQGEGWQTAGDLRSLVKIEIVK